MPVPKKRKKMGTGSKAARAVDSAAKGTATGGRKPNVPHERDARLFVRIPVALAHRLDMAAVLERMKHKGEETTPDKSLIAEQALTAWLDANGY